MLSIKTKCQQVIAVSAHGSEGQISMILETICVDAGISLRILQNYSRENLVKCNF